MQKMYTDYQKLYRWMHKGKTSEEKLCKIKIKTQFGDVMILFILVLDGLSRLDSNLRSLLFALKVIFVESSKPIGSIFVLENVEAEGYNDITKQTKSKIKPQCFKIELKLV